VQAAPADRGAVAAPDDRPVAVGDVRNNLPGMSVPLGGSDAAAGADKPLAAPAVRKFARELGVDLRLVPPTGKSGQVTREDVEAYVSRAGTSAAPSGSAASPAASQAPAPVPALAPLAPQAEEERLPIRGLRKRIYENMARSKHTAAHFTYVDECDASGLVLARERLKPLAAAEGVSLTYLPFIVKATVAALRKHPKLNCLVDDASAEIVLRRRFDIGLAVATDAGLIVPVLRGAERLSLLGIAREIERLAAAARSGKIAKEDLGGSSFTITSLGKLGGLFATPVVNYPEVAILGVHELKKRPVVRDDQIVIGHEMLLSLSFDHRIIDGDVGAAFAQEIIAFLENPDRLLLDA